MAKGVARNDQQEMSYLIKYITAALFALLSIKILTVSKLLKLLFYFYLFRNYKSKIMATTKIIVNSNGSLRVEGDFEVVDKSGNKYELGGRSLVSFCRCGLSGNKPFCDGSHKGHFEHEAVAFDLTAKK